MSKLKFSNGLEENFSNSLLENLKATHTQFFISFGIIIV